MAFFSEECFFNVFDDDEDFDEWSEYQYIPCRISVYSMETIFHSFQVPDAHYLHSAQPPKLLVSYLHLVAIVNLLQGGKCWVLEAEFCKNNKFPIGNNLKDSR